MKIEILKFKAGDLVTWQGSNKAALAEGVVKSLPHSGTRYEIFITKPIDPKLTRASYWVDAANLKPRVEEAPN